MDRRPGGPAVDDDEAVSRTRIPKQRVELCRLGFRAVPRGGRDQAETMLKFEERLARGLTVCHLLR
jgi:hypothetical protein